MGLLAGAVAIGANLAVGYGQCGSAQRAGTLSAADGGYEHNYGAAISVHDNTMVVGSPDYSAGGVFLQGAVHVYTRTAVDQPWRVEATVFPSDPSAESRFGYSVTVFRDFLAVGAPTAVVAGAANPNRGAVYVFRKVGGVWTQTNKFFRSDTSNPLLDFGYSVDLGSDGPSSSADPLLVAGSPSSRSNCSGVLGGGQIRGYRFTGGAWQDELANGGCPADYTGARFGHAVLIGRDGSLLVGAPGFTADQGAAFEYRPNSSGGTIWARRDYYASTFGSLVPAEFGSALAESADGSTLAFGAPGIGGAMVRSRLTQTQTNLGPGVPTAASDQFGHSIAVSSGGLRVWVGAPFYGTNNRGVIYAFDRQGSQQVWNLALGPVTGEPPQSQGWLGYRLACDSFSSGGTNPRYPVLAGAPQANPRYGEGSGSLVTFDYDLSPSLSFIEPNLGTSDGFGHSVAISGDTAVVGVPEEDSADGINAGAAYVYVRDSSGWVFQQRLVGANTEVGDKFGFSVDIHQDTIVVGATNDNNSRGSNAGSVYVFTRAAGGSTWSEQANLIDTSGAAADAFGWAVCINGNNLLVGAVGDDDTAGAAQGTVTYFSRTGTTWTLRQKFTPADAAAGDEFGNSIDIGSVTPGMGFARTYAVIGAYGKDTATGGTNAGSVYSFELRTTLSGPRWEERSQLSIDETGSELGDNFGNAVALAGNTLVVGSVLDDNQLGVDAGAAYVFTLNSSADWIQQAKLLASDGATLDRFGGSIAANGNTVVIGSPRHSPSGLFRAGRAYLYRRIGTTWSQQDDLAQGGPRADDQFGTSVALNASDTILVGAKFADNATIGGDSGSVTVFELNLVPPGIAQQPASVTTCRRNIATFIVGPSGAGPFTYQWAYRNASGTWINMLGGAGTLPNGSTYTGHATSTLVFNRPNVGSTRLRVAVSNACGTTTSNEAVLLVCAADLDDGSDTGECDGGVSIDDLLYFIRGFDAGTLRADLDDGSDTGTPDGGVTIEDLLYFLNRYAEGC